MKTSLIRIRPLISLTLLGSFLISLFSGVALYLRPEGALAHWLAWSWIGIDKKSWETIHIGAVLLLLISGLWHTLLNWKPLWGYLRSRTPSIKSHWREGLAALALTLLFSLGPLWHLPPFSHLSDLRGAIKIGKTQPLPLPPTAEAENLTLEDLTTPLNTTIETLQQRLLNHGLTLPPNHPTLSAIASANQLSPARIYQILKAD